MKIEILNNNNFVLKEIYTTLFLETEEGNQLGIAMRDDTLEMNIMPNKRYTKNTWRVNMQTGCIELMDLTKRSNPSLNQLKTVWIEFKDGQNPRTNEIIAVKGDTGPHPHLLRVGKGLLNFYKLDDPSIKLSYSSLTHWKLIESPY